MTNLEALADALRSASPTGDAPSFIVSTDGTTTGSTELGTIATTYLHAVATFVTAAAEVVAPKEVAGLLSAVSSSVNQAVFADELAISLSAEAFA